MLSTYDVTVGPMLRVLRNLRSIIQKADAYARDHGVLQKDLLDRRLSEDMFPLGRQIQIIVDGARGSAIRLANRSLQRAEEWRYAVFNRGDDSAFEPYPVSFIDAVELIDDAVSEIESVKPHEIQLADSSRISISMYGRKRVFERKDFILYYMIPNFYFHVSIAYALLRSAGVPLGKGDFEGEPVYQTMIGED
jgi:hypothetical protein